MSEKWLNNDNNSLISYLKQRYNVLYMGKYNILALQLNKKCKKKKYTTIKYDKKEWNKHIQQISHIGNGKTKLRENNNHGHMDQLLCNILTSEHLNSHALLRKWFF